MAGETYPGTSSASGAATWTPLVTIAGLPVSDRIIGEIRVDAEEGAARVADLRILPAPGSTFAVSDWVGQPITIAIADNASGTPASIATLFTGLIDTPTLDLVSKTISLRCTDNLQQILDGMSAAAIDSAITGGYASPVVFDPAARGWSRAQDRLSTVAASLDLDASGTLRMTAWQPAASPHMALTDSHVLDGSIRTSMAGRHQMVNTVAIDFGYRFPRVKAEGYPITYAYVDSSTIASHAAALSWWLQRSAVDAAIRAAGGTIESISYTPLPNTVIGGFTPGPSDSLLCMGFSALVSFDYAQTIEEQHTITVVAANSVAAIGAMSDRLSGSLEGAYPAIPVAETTMLLYANDISGIPPQDSATPVSGQTTSANVTLTPDTDRAAANAAMEALIAVAKVRIWASHRGHSVSASVALNPAVDLDKTIDVSVPGLHARGKCRSVTHRMAAGTGQAVSEFSLAICSVAGTGVSHPETATAAPTGSSPTSSSLAGTPTADFNFLAAEDHAITVSFPGVADAERNKATIPIASTYNAPLVEDILTITL